MNPRRILDSNGVHVADIVPARDAQTLGAARVILLTHCNGELAEPIRIDCGVRSVIYVQRGNVLAWSMMKEPAADVG